MKKVRRALSIFSLVLVLTLASGTIVQVLADGPQGQQDSKSKQAPPPVSFPAWLVWALVHVI